jgi:hypothetical protein
MMLGFALAAALANQAPTAPAPSCLRDTISRVVSDKDKAAPRVIQLRSGRHLRVLGQDFIDPRRWRRGDRVAICPTDDIDTVEVTNVQRGERLLTWKDARPR